MLDHLDGLSRAVRTLGQTTIGGTVAVILVLVAEAVLDVLSTGEAVTIAALVQVLVATLGAYLLRRLGGAPATSAPTEYRDPDDDPDGGAS